MTEVTILKTRDEVTIVGDYYAGTGRRGVVLLHMMPADRKSWVSFADKLLQKEFQVLAVDLRGHGESQGGPLGYKNFSDEEHQQSIFDVDAAVSFLRTKGVLDLHLAGASIGANLALQYAAGHHDVKSAVLLSPGLDYRGVQTTPFMKKLGPSQGVFFASGGDEDAYSRDTVRQLAQETALGDQQKLKIFDDAGHGTRIFETHPEFMDEVAEWLIVS